ncbi:N-formylglutamate deformylase [Flexibacterium corallicola]|uniref:N-formylglutamate deformylase n=1 Tax=Flexibacterium corallicola TaxID=3037259 RepID=UPI00286EB63A|nr:N-formylglutamate deformylase [Pseudovibrio sp. M1P-2-3]
MQPVEILQGDGPVVLSIPHSGTFLPPEVYASLNANGRKLADSDWHVDRLYQGLMPAATIVKANFHRYLIDANRAPSGKSLYPGQNTTTLCPTTDFNGQPIYSQGQELSLDEIEARQQTWHAPYHRALGRELERVKAKHGIAILYDCHSIRSKAPFLFEGLLPAFNIGTNSGASCAPEIEETVSTRTAQAARYTQVLNGRFKGGWITRHYGQPQTGIHAIQMELAQSTYLATEKQPFTYSQERAEKLRRHLKQVLEALEALAPKLAQNLPTSGASHG